MYICVCGWLREAGVQYVLNGVAIGNHREQVSTVYMDILLNILCNTLSF